MRSPSWVLVAVLANALVPSNSEAQSLTLACKATGGWRPSANDSNYRGRVDPGRCDANGLLQGDGVARVGQTGGFIRARFTDGLPIGKAAIISSDGSDVCKLDFISQAEISAVVTCSSRGKNWEFTSPTGFQLHWVSKSSSLPNAPGVGLYVNAKDVLVRASGDFTIELGQAFTENPTRQTGRLEGTTSFDMVPLSSLVGGKLSLAAADLELKYTNSTGDFVNSPWINRVSGHFRLRPEYLEVTISDNDFSRSDGSARLASGYPANLELSVRYSSGYEATLIPRSNEWFYYFRDENTEFNGLIQECLRDKRYPGALMHYSNRRPYLPTGGSKSSQFARPIQVINLDGCGLLKSQGKPDMLGVFKTNLSSSSREVTFRPF